MKTTRKLWPLLALLALCAQGTRAQSAALPLSLAPRDPAAKLKIPLDAGWRFREAGKGEWHPASVPGCVHTDLLADRLIEDPFYRDNEQKLQWIGKTDWEYETTFTAPPSVLKRRNVELVFEGLDTYADVFLNGQLLLRADNMFRTWRVDCKAALRPGENTLRVLFHSPVNEVLPLMAKMSYQLPAPNDQGEKTSPFTRKAPYQFGWDWGPRFVTSGVWRPVSLEAWDTARVNDLRLVTKQVGNDAATMNAEVEVISDGEADATVLLEDATDKKSVARKTVKLARGWNKVALDFTLPHPSLWWPNGLGAHPLYDFTARLLVGGKVLDQASTRTGIRSLELRRQKDGWGESFEFVVNGVPVFAKGANWIPADSFPTRMTRERYRQLVESARDANMNMLRVWGGGIYESDDFYELCDEMGLLVWQEFMFACSMYPGDQAFLDNVRAEAVDNVKRLRNHPSIVLWCGNNEVETAWDHWGWKQNLPASLWDDYKKIFHGVLPEVVAEYDPTRPYWPSSPSSNLEDDPDSQRVGDVHYWQVWHAAAPFTEYEKQFPRFMSEYGFQSFPSIETVNAYTVPSDHDIQSPVMLAHQKHPRGNQLIREYMLREYPEPKDFESFLYASQVLQAEGIKVGAEHLRRIMPRDMGSLYWQLDDCWPVASWSSIDYFGRWKALQYYARRFYSPLLISPHVEAGSVNVYVVSDRTQATPAELFVTLYDFDGHALSENRKSAVLSPLASKSYLTLTEDELLRGHDPKTVFLECELSVGGHIESTNHVFFRPFKELTLPSPHVTTYLEKTQGGFIVMIWSDKFARAVYLSAEGLDGYFADNYFDLVPGRPVTVEFRSRRQIKLDEFRKGLEVRSLVDAFP
jgi:beta-mannosidase